MQGLGSGAVPLAGAINWILKDGLGQLGGVLYASWFGDMFDEDPKRHRFISNIALQASTLLEVLTPLFPGLFLPLASISNVGKNISWLASSATRAQMHTSFVLRDNLGDITGKITAQSIAASIAGTGVGIIVSGYTGFETGPVLAAFVPFAAINLYTNYRSSIIVEMRGLNVQRAELVIADLLQGPAGTVLPEHCAQHNGRGGKTPEAAAPSTSQHEASSTSAPPSILTPADVAKEEKFVLPYRSVFGVGLLLEPLFSELAARKLVVSNLDDALCNASFVAPEQYMIGFVNDGPGVTGALPQVALWYDEAASARDHFAGLLHACCIRNRLALERTHDLAERDRVLDDIVAASHRQSRALMPSVWAQLQESGWACQHMFFAAKSATIRRRTAGGEL